MQTLNVNKAREAHSIIYNTITVFENAEVNVKPTKLIKKLLKDDYNKFDHSDIIKAMKKANLNEMTDDLRPMMFYVMMKAYNIEDEDWQVFQDQIS